MDYRYYSAKKSALNFFGLGTEGSFNDAPITFGDIATLPIVHYVFICIAIFFSTSTPVAHIFTTEPIPHRCIVKGCDETNGTFEPSWIRNVIPYLPDGLPAKCNTYFRIDANETDFCEFDIDNQAPFDTCSELIFQGETNSIQKSLNLVCDESDWKLKFVSQINSIGILISFPLLGILADRYGRLTILNCSLQLTVIIALLKTIGFSYILFVVCEFLEAVVSGGAFNIALVLVLESVPAKRRILLCAIVLPLCKLIGALCVPLISYILIDWRLFLWAIYISFLMFLYIWNFWKFPESICWLLVHGKLGDARTIIYKFSKGENTKCYNVNAISRIQNWYNGSISVGDDEFSEDSLLLNVKSSFSSVILLKRLYFCIIAWTLISFYYFGLMNNTETPRNFLGIQIEYFYMRVVEAPFIFLVWIVTFSLRGQRIPSLIMLSALTGFACLSVPFANISNLEEFPEWPKVPLQIFARISAASLYGIMHLVTAELFPTKCRATFLGFCSAFAQLSFIAASYSPYMKLLSMDFLPECFFSLLAFLTIGIVIFLPETKDTSLPMTISEAEKIIQ